MYVTERIVSIAIYLCLLFIVVFGLTRSKNNYRSIKKWLIFYVVALCFLTFLYIPAETSDLTRLRSLVDGKYVDMGFDSFVEILMHTSTYTTHIYYYVISKIGVIELLSVVSCLINYSIVCYVLYDYSKRNNIKGTAIAIALLFYAAIGGYIEIVSGFRSMCAFSIFFFCIYREFFQKKLVISDLLLYLIAIGFHNAVVPVVLFRFLFLLVQKEDKTIIKILNYVMFGLLTLFTINYGSEVIEATTAKAQNYLDNGVFSYFWTYLSSSLTIGLVIYLLIINRKVIKERIPKNYYWFFVFFMVFDIISISMNYTIFRRYSRILAMLSLPLIMESFNVQFIETGRFSVKKQNVLFYILMFMILLIEASRGDLCGIRFLTF